METNILTNKSSSPEENIQTETIIRLVDNKNNQKDHQSLLLLDESRLVQAINTLESLLNTLRKNDSNLSVSNLNKSSNGKHNNNTNSHHKLLKRLNHIAKQIVLQGLNSKREQRNKLNQLLTKHDRLIAETKGIRVLRGKKASSLNKNFEHQFKSTNNASLEFLKENKQQLIVSLDKTSSIIIDQVGGDDSTTNNKSKSASSGTTYENGFECYICKLFPTSKSSHSFYDQMCIGCGDFNYMKRQQKSSLVGYIALVTGGRLKIGYETALKLLRCGANVIITTRFPADAAFRYSKESDFSTWAHRLDISGVDFRFLAMVEDFCSHLNTTYKKLDILIQNSAQTIRRPPQYYKHLLQFECSLNHLPLQLKNLVKHYNSSASPINFMTNTGKNSVESPTSRNLWNVDSLALQPVLMTDNNDMNKTEISLSNTSEEGEGTLNEIFARDDDFQNQNSTTMSILLSNVSTSAACSQLMVHSEDHEHDGNDSCQHLFPSNSYDEHHQQLDLRPVNSWRLQLDEIDKVELIEVSLINSIAPFIILNKLTPLMAAARGSYNNNHNNTNSDESDDDDEDAPPSSFGFIIMVSSMEGKFSRTYKTTAHPHTNCAKASLNMMVRTSAKYYKAKYNILMNAVDTGWVTDEDPTPMQNDRKSKFHPPLDEVDGAARILDPIFQALNENKIIYGSFLKDYNYTNW